MENREINIKFIDWENRNFRTGNYLPHNIVLESLEKYYKVSLSNNPDIVFCGFSGSEFTKYNCIRVLFNIEEYAPNFNAYDYAVTIYDGMTYKDRIFTGVCPLIAENAKRDHDLALNKHLFLKEDLLAKKGFCSYVQSNETAGNKPREQLISLLNSYKTVDAGGKHLNTIGYCVDDKVKFESNYKFSISFLNSRSYTYQDRPTDAFAAKTIPIYMGNPDIAKIFNPKAFINCHDYNNFNEVVEYVKIIDNDDDLYLSMIQEPAFLYPKTSEEIQKEFDNFLINIVENGTIQRGTHYAKVGEKELVIGRKAIRRRRFLTILLVNLFKPFTKSIFGQLMRKKIMGY